MERIDITAEVQPQFCMQKVPPLVIHSTESESGQGEHSTIMTEIRE